VRTIVLIGLMGSGKSSVGALLAERTGLRLVDVDLEILASTGRTVRELWEEGGEAAYRRLESRVVLETIGSTEATVLAAPGGAILDPAVQAALGETFVVWLRASPGTLSARVRPDDHRPLLEDDPFPVLATMEARRADLYERTADLVVDTDQLDAAAAASVILEALRDPPQGG
jgi:shikimate kinase